MVVLCISSTKENGVEKSTSEIRLIALPLPSGVGSLKKGATDRIQETATCGLTPREISKRHARILAVLLDAASLSEEKRVYLPLKDVHECVVRMSNKEPPFMDTEAFLFDLANRGYVHYVEHGKYGDVFGLMPKGELLLYAYENLYGTTYRESRTPNRHPDVTH